MGIDILMSRNLKYPDINMKLNKNFMNSIGLDFKK